MVIIDRKRSPAPEGPITAPDAGKQPPGRMPGSRLRFAGGYLGAACAALMATNTPAFAQRPNPFESTPGQIEIVPIRGHIFLLAGAGANMILSIGADGVFVVDSGLAQYSPQVIAAINKFTGEMNREAHLDTSVPPAPPKPIQFIANTTIFPDHIGGNEKLAAAGKTFTGGNVAADLAAGFTNDDATIFATDKALARMTNLPGNAQPSETFGGDHYKVSHFFNDEGIELFHMPNANTDGDMVVHFRGSDVIATGDIFNMASYPVLDLTQGGSIQGELAALNRLIDMSVAYFRTEGGTLVIPGHGRAGDLADLTYYRDMCTIIRDRIQDMIKSGMNLDQIQTAKPTADWDPRFGQNPSWTPAQFVDAIYKGLTRPISAKKPGER
jgi:cyclase